MNYGISYIAGIGAYAGGLEALEKFFGNIAVNSEISFVVVQHLPRDFKTQLDKIISKHTTLPVKILRENQTAQPNNIYVLPGQLRVIIKNGILILRERLPDEIINYSVNEFLISLAQDRKEKAIGIILAGTGFDGSDGVKAVSDNGGIVLIQDPDSTTFKTMPLAAINSDHPDKVLSPAQLGARLMETIHNRNPSKEVKS